MDILLYLVICLFATAVGAVSGIGGGVIIKPLFDLVTDFTPSVISFLSGCTVLSMTVVSLLRSRNSPIKIEKRRGTLLGVGAAVGGILGKLLFDSLRTAAGREELIGGIQNSMMVLLTLGVFIYMLNKERIRTHNINNPLLCLCVGVFLGAAGAFLGIGGGPINLVVLYYFFSMDTKTAALNSLYIIFFSQTASLLSLIVSANIPEFQLGVLCVMVFGGITGGFLGRSVVKKLSSAQTDRLFSAVLLLIVFISAYNVVKFIV